MLYDISNVGNGSMTGEAGNRAPLLAALTFYCQERDAAAARARKQLGVNELDANAMSYVAKNPGARPSEMAGYLGVTSAGVTTMVERLVRRGILRREADETDRRVNHIHLAVDLEKEPWSQLALFDATCQQIIAGLDPQVADDFADFLKHTALAAREESARVDRAAA